MKPVATIKDIARELGISTSTVSRILNGLHQGNADLAKKVQETATKLNYQVNTAAKGLRTNKTNLIGLIVPDVGDDFFAAILSGIEQQAELNGYNLMICQSNESFDKEADLIKSLIACNVEGILIASSLETKDSSNLELIKKSGKEAVLFDRPFENDLFPNVAFDDSLGTYLSGRHLINQGHKRFLYLGLSRQLPNDEDRLMGYNKALREGGLSPCKVIYVDQMDTTEAKLTTHWKSGEYDAVVCFNDIIAARALAFFNENKIGVPSEISLMGFDNRILCEFTYPKLSSVEHSAKKMGEMAADQLLKIINNIDVEPKENIPELVLRNTTRSRL
ncbi:MAG: DNA-binding LacI/PurR family transcriptional regulator [Marinoscillum sp.]|jgi:DNA-binding LacI/PurR family transcriptional regulator